MTWLQGALFPGGLFAWAEISADGSRVDWAVTAYGDECLLAWGTDRVRGRWQEDDRERAMEQAMASIRRRWGNVA